LTHPLVYLNLQREELHVFKEVGNPMPDYNPYQQKVIKRYYDNKETIQRQRLGELVSELFLARGKKRQRAWESAIKALQELGIPQSRINHLLKQDNPALLAEVVKELEAK